MGPCNFCLSAFHKLKRMNPLVDELADVLMYYNDVLLCYGITAEELKRAYTAKFQKNLTRW